MCMLSSMLSRPVTLYFIGTLMYSLLRDFSLAECWMQCSSHAVLSVDRGIMSKRGGHGSPLCSIV